MVSICPNIEIFWFLFEFYFFDYQIIKKIFKKNVIFI